MLYDRWTPGADRDKWSDFQPDKWPKINGVTRHISIYIYISYIYVYIYIFHPYKLNYKKNNKL